MRLLAPTTSSWVRPSASKGPLTKASTPAWFSSWADWYTVRASVLLTQRDWYEPENSAFCSE